MATFSLATGILTEEWQQTSGIGGIHGWTCRGICTDLTGTYDELSRYMVTRYRFEPVPYRRALVCVSLDGSPIVPLTIDVRLGPITDTNTAPVRYIYNCIKLGPIYVSNYAPMQDSGTYAGISLMQYEVQFQPLTL